MIAVLKREFKSYFSCMTGYVASVLVLIMSGIFIKIVSIDNGVPMMEYALPTVSMILLLAVPIITMSSFAGEKQLKTEQLLYSLPLTSMKIVVGKYLAMVGVFSVPTAVLCLFPLVLNMYGSVNLFASYSSLLTFYFLICSMVAICMFMSSISESTVTAAVLGAGVLILLYFSNTLATVIPTTAFASFIAFSVVGVLVSAVVYAFIRDLYISCFVLVICQVILSVVYYFEKTVFLGLIQKVVSAISLFDRFDIAVRSQMLDVKAIVYYISVSVLFVFITQTVFEKKRYV